MINTIYDVVMNIKEGKKVYLGFNVSYTIKSYKYSLRTNILTIYTNGKTLTIDGDDIDFTCTDSTIIIYDCFGFTLVMEY